MNAFDSFRKKVFMVRKRVEDFKDNHSMASEAISLVIDSMPQPFNKFCSVVWDGLEKEGARGSSKFLEVLQKLENNTEQSFSNIESKISQLLLFGVTAQDIEKIADQIRISDKAVIKHLERALHEEITKACERLEQTFQQDLIEFRLLGSDIELVTVKKRLEGEIKNVGTRDIFGMLT